MALIGDYYSTKARYLTSDEGPQALRPQLEAMRLCHSAALDLHKIRD